ncbi:MAG: hypothetical protein AAGE01_19285 [Pseudomonadota bacterium]
MTTRALGSRLASAVAVLFFLLAAAAALLIGHAELELHLASTRLDASWNNPTDTLPVDQAEAQLGRAGLALQRGELYARRGELALVRALQSNGDRERLLEARAWMNRAIRARPLWPQFHAWRAVINARLSDAEGTRADQRSARDLGPNSAATLVVLYPHVGALGPWLDLGLAEDLLALAERAARFQAKPVVAIMRRFGWLELWCLRPQVQLYELRDCERALASLEERPSGDS